MKFRYDAMVILRKELQGSAGAPPILRAITAWTSLPTPNVAITLGDPMYATAVQLALTSQTAIGWTHFFHGFVSHYWGCIYTDDDATSLENRLIHANSYLSKITRAVQDYSLALWTARNAVLHEHASSTQLIVNAELNHAISQLYAQQSVFSPVLQSYFRTPLDKFLKRPVRYRQRWLRLATLATLHSSSSGSREQLLSTYFPYVSPPATTTRPVLSPPVPPAIPGILHQLSL